MFRGILLILVLFIIFLHLQLMGVGDIMQQCLDQCNITTINDKNINNHKQNLTFDCNNQFINNKVKLNQKIMPCPTKEPSLVESWEYYKKTFISSDGRVIDYQKASITTSEGQAYAMRRALLMRDKETFDKTYNWTKYNLQHKQDKLFAWLWGQKKPVHEQGEIKYGIIDQNSASDAGVEIADCLILASKVWNQPYYAVEAKGILNDIWNKETIQIKGERILVSGINQKNSSENIEINPSYFMPNSFKTFAKVDKTHKWLQLVNSSYRLTNWCITHIPSGLPPDVFYMNKKTGEIIFERDKSDFSYDAVRIFYRFYIDYKLSKDARAEKLLSKSKLFLSRWKNEEKFYTNYKQNGELKDYNEPIGSIALIVPVIKIYDKNAAEEIYKSRIRDKCNNEGFCEVPMDYYAQNLIWFGNWLYLNEKNVQIYKY